jgi:hypothetical protein
MHVPKAIKYKHLQQWLSLDSCERGSLKERGPLKGQNNLP